MVTTVQQSVLDVSVPVKMYSGSKLTVCNDSPMPCDPKPKQGHNLAQRMVPDVHRVPVIDQADSNGCINQDH